MLAAPPYFVVGSPLLEGSYAMALAAHHGPRREGHTDIDHPVAVAQLMYEAKFSQQVVAAALLHDVVEDTETKLSEIRSRFGPEVAELVGEMTEDEKIRPYRPRKEEHRRRVAGDRRVAAIYAADKLASTRALHDQGEQPEARRHEHFRTTLVQLSETHPTLPFLAELRAELDRLE